MEEGWGWGAHSVLGSAVEAGDQEADQVAFGLNGGGHGSCGVGFCGCGTAGAGGKRRGGGKPSEECVVE